MIEEVSPSPGPSHLSGSAQVALCRKKPKSNAQKESLRARKNIEQNNVRVSGGSHHPCLTCLKNSVPAKDPPTHSCSSSKKCPFYQKNKCAMAKEAFGMKPEMFTIKMGCKQACQIPGLQQEIFSAIERIHDVTFEASLLANHHFMQCMEDDGVIGSDCFNQNFFLTCMKLVAIGIDSLLQLICTVPFQK